MWADPAEGETAEPLRTPFLGADGRVTTLVRPEFRGAPELHEDLLRFEIAGLETSLVGPFVIGPVAGSPPVPGRILLRGAPEAVAAGRAVLGHLDLPRPAVMVSLLAAEVRCIDRSERGGHLGFSRVGIPEAPKTLFRGTYSEFEPGSFLRSSIVSARPFQGTSIRFANVGHQILENGAFEYVLRMLAEEDKAEFLAWPTIICTEGLPGTVTTTEAQWQSLVTPALDPNAVRVSVRPEETGVALTVVPVRVGADAALIDLTADLSFLLPETADGLAAGEMSRSVHRVATRFTIRDRETLLIGGLTIRRRTKVARGLPLLTQAPLISEHTRAWRTSQLVLLVRARVLYAGPDEAGMVLPPGEARRLDQLGGSQPDPGR